jgi:protein SCO1/2
MFKSRHFIFVLIAVLFPLLTACTGSASPTPTPTDMPEGVTIVDPPGDPAVFALTDKTGDELTLADVEGKYTLFFFGYTNCPDFCPNTLANFLIVKQLLADKADDVNFMLISVDGKRDTPERLTEYTESFDPTFLAATGSDDVLPETVSQFGAQYFIEDDTEENYLVEHTTSSFLLDPEGRWIRLYSFGTDPQVMATDIGQLVDSTATSDA